MPAELTLPELRPVLITEVVAFEPVIRDAEARLSALRGQRDMLLHQAEAAARRVEATRELEAARQTLAISVARLKAERRQELVEELERARAHAVAMVHEARVQADAEVGAAAAHLIRLLGGSGASSRVTTPLHPASGAALRVVGARDALTEPPRPDPVRGIADPVSDPPAASTEAQTQKPTAAAGREPTHPLVLAAPVVATTQTRPAVWARYLYVDVVLPIIAVLVVVMVLLAWVG